MRNKRIETFWLEKCYVKMPGNCFLVFFPSFQNYLSPPTPPLSPIRHLRRYSLRQLRHNVIQTILVFHNFVPFWFGIEFWLKNVCDFFMILKPLVFVSTNFVESSVYVLRKKMSSSFQKCIGLRTFYELCQHDSTIKQHTSSKSLTSMYHWRHLFTTYYSTEVMTSDWMTSDIELDSETIAWWRHSSCTSSFCTFFSTLVLRTKKAVTGQFLGGFFSKENPDVRRTCTHLFAKTACRKNQRARRSFYLCIERVKNFLILLII